MERPVSDDWNTGRAECLYLVTDYSLELAKQFKFECEKEQKTGKPSALKHILKNQISVLEIIETNIENLKPGSFSNKEYVPHIAGLNIIKK